MNTIYKYPSDYKSALFLFLIICLIPFSLHAQFLHFYQNDGSKVIYKMSDVDSLTFITYANQGKPCQGTPTVTDIDGNVYNTVYIGLQCWMAQNLNTTRNPDGYPLLYFCPMDSTHYCNIYGKLYDYHTVMDPWKGKNSNYIVQGICPDGWHVPSTAEWNQLIYFLESQGYPNDNNNPIGAGNALKSCRQISSPLGGDCDTQVHPRWVESPANHGFDQFNFSALPPGSVWYSGDIAEPGYSGIFWSRDKQFFVLRADISDLRPDSPYSDSESHSVRCVKD